MAIKTKKSSPTTSYTKSEIEMIAIDDKYISTLKQVYYAKVKDESCGELELNVYEHYPFKDYDDELSKSKYFILTYAKCAYIEAKSLKTLIKKINALGFSLERNELKKV